MAPGTLLDRGLGREPGEGTASRRSLGVMTGTEAEVGIADGDRLSLTVKSEERRGGGHASGVNNNNDSSAGGPLTVSRDSLCGRDAVLLFAEVTTAYLSWSFCGAEKEREGERQRQREREREKERDKIGRAHV